MDDNFSEYKVVGHNPKLQKWADLCNKFKRKEDEFKTIIIRFEPVCDSTNFFINGCASTITDLVDQMNEDVSKNRHNQAAGIKHPVSFISLTIIMSNNSGEITKLTQKFLEQRKILEKTGLKYKAVEDILNNIDAHITQAEAEYKLIYEMSRNYEKLSKEITEAYKTMTKKYKDEYNKYLAIGIQNKQTGRNVVSEIVARFRKQGKRIPAQFDIPENTVKPD
jgi:hypothetical protein